MRARGARRFAFFAAIVACLGAGAASAEEPTVGIGDDSVIVYPSQVQQRRAELRRALVGSDETLEGRRERRRLSREERDELNQGLRKAMRGAYEANPPTRP